MSTYGVMESDRDFLPLSGLQHLVFCRRQWALIYIEKQWKDNLRTVEGDLFHRRAHDETQRERRGDLLIVRGLPVCSQVLGISGQCDVVEFRLDAGGVSLHGEEGLWQPFPVEYKRGSPKLHDADRLQLCAQAMCLEEMLCCTIEEGALFYGELRHRERVVFSKALRLEVRERLAEMHRLYRRGHTPEIKCSKSCNACSMRDLCIPFLTKSKSVRDYLIRAVEEEI